MAAAWLALHGRRVIGGLVMIAVMIPVSQVFVRQRVIDKARKHDEMGQGHYHGAMTLAGDTWLERLRNPQALPTIASAFAMDWRMLWKDFAIGFLIAGMLSALVPEASGRHYFCLIY